VGLEVGSIFLQEKLAKAKKGGERQLEVERLTAAYFVTLNRCMYKGVVIAGFDLQQVPVS